MRPLLACTRFRRPRLTHACDRPARRWIAREATAVGESAPTSTPRLVSANRVTSRSSQVVWLKARRSSGHNPASTEARAVRSPEAHGPFTGGLSSCHRCTEFARRNARRRAAGAGSVPRARASEKERSVWVHIFTGGTTTPPSLHPCPRSFLFSLRRITPHLGHTSAPSAIYPPPYPRSFLFSLRESTPHLGITPSAIYPPPIPPCPRSFLFSLRKSTPHLGRVLAFCASAKFLSPQKAFSSGDATHDGRAEPGRQSRSSSSPRSSTSHRPLAPRAADASPTSTLATQECCKSSLSRLPEKCRS